MNQNKNCILMIGKGDQKIFCDQKLHYLAILQKKLRFFIFFNFNSSFFQHLPAEKLFIMSFVYIFICLNILTPRF